MSFALVLVATLSTGANAGTGTTSTVFQSYASIEECKQAAAATEVAKVAGNLSFAVVCVPQAKAAR